MEAKDTVRLVPDHSESVYCSHCGEETGIEDRIQYEREYQAQISFKAGYDKGRADEREYMYNREWGIE